MTLPAARAARTATVTAGRAMTGCSMLKRTRRSKAANRQFSSGRREAGGGPGWEAKGGGERRDGRQRVMGSGEHRKIPLPSSRRKRGSILEKMQNGFRVPFAMRPRTEPGQIRLERI